MTARLANLAEAAALTLRRLAHDLDLASTHPSPQASATVAESRREARAALRELSAALPAGDDNARAYVQSLMVKDPDNDREWLLCLMSKTNTTPAPLTLSRLARIKPTMGSSVADCRHVLGPVFVRRMPDGQHEVAYLTRSLGMTIAIVADDSEATVSKAIGAWIDDTNRAARIKAASLAA